MPPILILSILSAIVYIFYTTGQLVQSFDFFIFSSFLLSLWYLVAFLSSPSKFIRIWDKKYIFLFLFLLYHFISGLQVNGLRTQINETTSMFLFFSPIYIYDYYKQLKSRRINLIFIISILLVLCVYSIKTIIYLKIHPLAARDLVSTGIDESVLIGGGFALANALAILVPCLVYILLNTHKIILEMHKITYFFIFIIFLIILFSYTVFLSLFTISIVLMITGSILCLFIRNEEKILPAVSALILICILLFYFIGPIIGSYIINTFGNGNSYVAHKMLEIGYAFQGKGESFSSDLYSRFRLYFSSFEVFKNNFLFGIGHETGYDGNAMQRIGLGEHSEWFDSLAIYGLAGGIPLFYFLYLKVRENTLIVSKIGGLIFLVLGFLNPNKFFTIYLVIFLLLPMINNYNLKKPN